MMNEVKNTVILGKACLISAGYPLRGSTESLKLGGTRFIQLRDIKANYIRPWDEITEVDLANIKKAYLLKSGDILFAARGLNNYAIALSAVPENTVCAPHFFVIRIKDSTKINPDFLAWQLNQKPAQNYFKRMAVGSALPNIRRRALDNLNIALPPLDQQKLIANIWKAGREEERAMQNLISNRNKQLEAIAFNLAKTGSE